MTQNVQKLQKRLIEGGVSAALVNTHIHLFYLLGEVYDGYLYIPAEGEPINFVKKGKASGKTVEIRKPEQISDMLGDFGISRPEKLMIEDDYLSMRDCTRLLKAFACEAAPSVLRELRTVKSDEELEKIKYSSAMQINVYKKIPDMYETGMTDLDLQIKIEHEMRLLGSGGLMRAYGGNMELFCGMLMVGDNALECAPFAFAMGGKGRYPDNPIGACGIEIKQANTAMIDITYNNSGYLCDMTRVFSRGRLSDEAYRLHNISIEMVHSLADMIKPGVACCELFEKAEAIIKKYGVAEHYMEKFNNTRFTGHGVGMEINEPPVITKNNKLPLEKGMTIAIEPKFALKGIGGIGIENTYAVTDTGYELLTEMDESIMLFNER